MIAGDLARGDVKPWLCDEFIVLTPAFGSRYVQCLRRRHNRIGEEHEVNPLNGFSVQNTGPVLLRTFIW
jgi:hypothetical protein